MPWFAPAWPKLQSLFRCIPQIVDCIGIWGVWGQGLRLGLFVMFPELLLDSFCGVAGRTALLEEVAAVEECHCNEGGFRWVVRIEVAST